MNKPFGFLARMAGLILLVHLAGCGGPESVSPVSRSSSNAPVLADEAVESGESGNSFDLSFLNEDHFACCSFDVTKILADPDLNEVPWDVIEERLAKWVGKENASLRKIERAWLVLDRSILAGEAESVTGSWILILDYLESCSLQPMPPPSEEALGESSSSGESSLEVDTDLATPEFGALQIGDHRVALGSPTATASLVRRGASTELVSSLRQMKLESEAEGVVSIGPIRTLLESIFEMAAAFGGDELVPFQKLPELLQRIEVRLNFDSEQMILVDVNIDDEEVAKSIAVLLSGASQGGSSLASIGAFGGNPNTGPAMLPNDSLKLFQQIAKEIQTDDLYSVNVKEQRVSFMLKRPRQMQSLVSALVVDWKREMDLNLRVEKIRLIASALDLYEEKHGCLPARGRIGANEDGLPQQFNWRVGLLPYLGEQELYDQFNFDEAWDSESNLKIAQKVPKAFAVAEAAEGDRGKTRIHVVGGDVGLFNREDGPQVSEITDPLVSTAVVIEGAGHTAVVWTQPGAMEITGPIVEQMGRADEGGVLIVNGKFRPRIIKKELGAIRSVLSPDGGEKVPFGDFLKIPSRK